MTKHGLGTIGSFERITARDVESHLTSIAVDGNVAESTPGPGLLRDSVSVRTRSQTRPQGGQRDPFKQAETDTDIHHSLPLNDRV